MSNIKGRDTAIEVKVRSHLHKLGYRFRVNDKRYLGKPDIVLPKYKTIIFVNGCFWHSHKCEFSSIPKSNVEFWTTKLSKTVERDKMILRKLTKDGWKVIVIWECEIKYNFEETMEKLVLSIQSEKI